MKKLLTIFSVFLCCYGFLYRNSWGAGSCKLHLCKTNEDTSELLSKDGQTKNSDFELSNTDDLKGQQCFHCDINNMFGGIGNDDCSHNTQVATVSSNGTQRLFSCVNKNGDDDSWEQVKIDNLAICSDSQLSREGVSNSTCIFTDNGREIRVSQVVSNPCLMCSCDDGYMQNGNDCVLDTSAQTICENAPSHGTWDGGICKCIKEGQKDKDPGKTCECQTGLVFDDSQDMCINPKQSEIDNCSASGGRWDMINDKCVCDKTKGFDETPVDGKCVCVDAPKKQYDVSKDACVNTEQAICTDSGGDWDDGLCTCDSEKHLKEKRGVIPTQCECESDRYEYDEPRSNGCKLSEQAALEENTFNVLQTECEKSGGVWLGYIMNPDSWECVCDAANGLRSENKVCVCLNEQYQRSKSNPKKCELLDIAQAENNCIDARDNGEDVVWIDAGKDSYCKCLDSSKYYDYDTKKCNLSLEQWCKKISGAHMMHGKCVCKATGTEPVNGRCPTDNKQSSQPSPTTNKAAIKKAYEALGPISQGWGQSHWKTASGNFNSARLASDSVAGVVLGTVGGVITSNVIKKNQVRNGFEDLRCVIGGQTVADWGDQFMVGVQ